MDIVHFLVILPNSIWLFHDLGWLESDLDYYRRITFSTFMASQLQVEREHINNVNSRYMTKEIIPLKLMRCLPQLSEYWLNTKRSKYLGYKFALFYNSICKQNVNKWNQGENSKWTKITKKVSKLNVRKFSDFWRENSNL